MNGYVPWVTLFIAAALAALLENKLKRPVLRKWGGLGLLAASPALLFGATSWATELQFVSLPIIAFITGINLSFTQNKYRRLKPDALNQPLQLAPTMNLAPNSMSATYLSIKPMLSTSTTTSTTIYSSS